LLNAGGIIKDEQIKLHTAQKFGHLDWRFYVVLEVINPGKEPTPKSFSDMLTHM